MLALTTAFALLAGLLLLACGFSVIGLAVSPMPANQPTVEQLVDRLRGAHGWALVEQATRAVHAAMPDYGFCNGFDTPRIALTRARGYCWQRAGVLRSVLRASGIEADMVHAFWTRFGRLRSGHVWLSVTIDGESRWVCPGDPNNTPGKVHFEPLSRVRRWGPAILVLSYLGSPIANVFAFVAHRLRGGSLPGVGERVAWRTRLARNGLWLLIPILVWNAALSSSLPRAFADDTGVPVAVSFIEAMGRVFVFAAPTLLVLGLDDRARRAGLGLFVLGTLAYFAAWLPALLDPTPTWLWLGPFVLPAAWLIGLGLMARSGAYIVGALVFVCAHVTHGVVMLARS